MDTHAQSPTRRITLGADRSYDKAAFVGALRDQLVSPHVAQHTTRRASGIDGQTTCHAGYITSQQIRKWAERVLGWLKTVRLLRKDKLRAMQRRGWHFAVVVAAYNLMRIWNLMAVAT